VINRRRGVLLTAKAEDRFDTDLSAAKAAALEAHRLLPDFAPAAVIAAKALFRQNDIRKGAKILEAAWKTEPHPDVADLYVHARPGDAVLDRLSRARKLEALRQNNVESSLIVARAALDAHEFKAAREAAEAAIRMQPREGAYLLLADIEEAETGDQGRVRQFLAMAVRAARDPAWVADGFVSERWAPVSPVTGRLDAFEWRVPVERLGPLIEQQDAASIHPSLALPMASDAIELEDADKAIAGPMEVVDVAEAETSPADATVVEKQMPASGDVEQDKPKPEAVEQAEPPRMPDDPGVEPSQGQSERRFRLF
jgi:HemY protein